MNIWLPIKRWKSTTTWESTKKYLQEEDLGFEGLLSIAQACSVTYMGILLCIYEALLCEYLFGCEVLSIPELKKSRSKRFCMDYTQYIYLPRAMFAYDIQCLQWLHHICLNCNVAYGVNHHPEVVGIHKRMVPDRTKCYCLLMRHHNSFGSGNIEAIVASDMEMESTKTALVQEGLL